MPPLIALALGVMGAAALVRWCVKEVRRVNSELDDVRCQSHRRTARPQQPAEAQARSEDRRVPAGLGIPVCWNLAELVLMRRSGIDCYCVSLMPRSRTTRPHLSYSAFMNVAKLFRCSADRRRAGFDELFARRRIVERGIDRAC